MSQNQDAGPQIGQTVLWWTGSVLLPALVYAVSGGVASLTIFNGASVTTQANAQYDGTRTLASSWSWPDLVSGV
jgi:hypothetical protein